MIKAAAKHSMKNECEHRTSADHERSDSLTHSKQKQPISRGSSSSAATLATGEVRVLRGKAPERVFRAEP